MSRRFDSYRMASRAFALSDEWRNDQHYRDTRNSALVCMPDALIARMERAAAYLWRRFRRTHPEAPAF